MFRQYTYNQVTRSVGKLLVLYCVRMVSRTKQGSPVFTRNGRELLLVVKNYFCPSDLRGSSLISTDCK